LSGKFARALAILAPAVLALVLLGDAPPAFARAASYAHAGHGAGGLADQEIVYFAARIAYYAGLLTLSGLLFWRVARHDAFPSVSQMREKAIAAAGKCMMLAVLVYIVLSLMNLAQGEPFSVWLQILLETRVGRQLAGILLLGLIAPLVSYAGKFFGWGWAVLALMLEAWSGHASTYSPAAYTVGLDFAHLAAASLWAGGLVLLFAVWWKARFEAARFARVFGRFALVSVAALWVTGALSVLEFLPSPEYLTYTAWGKWLLVKMAAALLVIAVAFFIRRHLRRKRLLSGWLLQADLGLLAVIVAAAGIFTYLSPMPQNEPLYYHKMGTDLHLTLRIMPNEPGKDNRFIVKVWLPENTGEPRSVRLFLAPDGGDAQTRRAEVPLEPYIDSEFDVFEGFAKFTYEAEGPYLPHAGLWQAEVEIIDSQGGEHKVSTSFRLY